MGIATSGVRKWCIMASARARAYNVRFEDEKLTKKQTYTQTETWKLYSRVFWTFMPYVVKIDRYNFELNRFKVDAFFETQWRRKYAFKLTHLLNHATCLGTCPNIGWLYHSSVRTHGTYFIFETLYERILTYVFWRMFHTWNVLWHFRNNLIAISLYYHCIVRWWAITTDLGASNLHVVT